MGKGSGWRKNVNMDKYRANMEAIFGRRNTPAPKVEADAKKDAKKKQCRRPIDRLPEGYDESA
jgi:hypothetical protein